MATVSLTVNGKAMSAEASADTLLVNFIRENLGMTGTHVGCDTSQCGACVVMVNGDSVKSCTMLAVQAEGAEVTTVEGLASNGDLHPMQQAFHDNHALQCGFCTPGMLITARDVVLRSTNLNEEQVRIEMSGNLCRCGAYDHYLNGVMRASGQNS